MPTVSISPSLNQEKELMFEVQAEKILYDELENQGHILPHGCLAGSCGSCRIEIIEGAQNLMPPGVVEADTIQSIKNNYRDGNMGSAIENKIIRLSCRAKVLGNIKIALLK
jgi:ferredoxin